MPRIQLSLPILRPLGAPRASACRPLCRFSTTTRLRVEGMHSEASLIWIALTNTYVEPQVPASKTPGRPAASAAASVPPQASSPSRAADLAAAEAVTEADSAQSPAPKPTLPSDHTESSEPTDSTPLTTSNPSKNPTTVDGTITTPKKAQIEKKRWTKEQRAEKAPLKRHNAGPKEKKRFNTTKLELPPAKYHVARSMNNNYPIYTDYKRGGNLKSTTVRKITGDLSALRDELRVFLNLKNEEVLINRLTQQVKLKGHHTSKITEFLKARGM